MNPRNIFLKYKTARQLAINLKIRLNLNLTNLLNDINLNIFYVLSLMGGPFNRFYIWLGAIIRVVYAHHVTHCEVNSIQGLRTFCGSSWVLEPPKKKHSNIGVGEPPFLNPLFSVKGHELQATISWLVNEKQDSTNTLNYAQWAHYGG